MTEGVRILLLADTHLGFDDPAHPRVQRRRRGPDFFAGFERALLPARRGEVDLVVHGGDLLYRSRVSPGLVERALAPLLRVADLGVPVFLVPGNHERSRIPYPLLAQHRHLHVFHRPHTFTATAAGLRVALTGFPFARRVDLPRQLHLTGWRNHDADIRLLCMHQAVDGAQVGVQNFTFRAGDDVVAQDAIPRGFAAVLSGHIHRWQVLDGGTAPVLYPGSVERTSFQERREEKGYLLLRVESGPDGGRLVDWRFVHLPTRPMRVVELDAQGLPPARLEARLRARLAACDPEAVVRVDVQGAPLPADLVRSLAPPGMNVTVSRRRAEAAPRRREGGREHRA
ncbi:MAG: metallophosphoesterase family protein [Planctomycetota bacterium]